MFVIDGNCSLGRERQMPGREARLGQGEGVGCRAHREGLVGMHTGHLWWQQGRQNVGGPRQVGAGESIRLLASAGLCFLSEIGRKAIY